jgi:hypothetical protein
VEVVVISKAVAQEAKAILGILPIQREAPQQAAYVSPSEPVSQSMGRCPGRTE